MSNSYLKRIFAWYGLTLVIAWVIMVLPLPDSVRWGKPAIILLAVIYWDLVLPEYIGLIHNWAVGIITDILLGCPLGLHGFSMVVIGYFVLKMGIRIRTYPLVQQTLYVLLYAAVYQSIIVSFYLWQGTIELINWHELILYWLPVFTTALCWPVLVVSLESAGCSYLRELYAFSE